jgi:outer membrane lipoprotein-sorting protein
MLKKFFLIVFLLSPLCLITAHAADDNAVRAKKILAEIDDLWRGKSSYAVTKMVVKTQHYTRTMRMEGWSKGKEKTVFRVLEPLREKGSITLKSDNNIFTYLPKTDRTIKLTSGMMMGSWMGSHLTNDDLVKESRLEEDYEATISFEGERKGQQVIEFTLIPKPEAAVVWGKLVLTITANGYLPVDEFYYDEDMKLARTITFSDIKKLGGRDRPAILRVIPADKPTEYTEFVYESLEFDIEVSDKMFTLSTLKQR